VNEVRLLKPIDDTDPWPSIDRLWRAAILDWRYQPTIVDGTPVAVCLPVTVIIDVM
jgi:hypothetical protein